MGFCNLCDPPARIPDEEIALHLKTEHDLDLDAEVQKWPDGGWVVHDLSLEPDDFAADERQGP